MKNLVDEFTEYLLVMKGYSDETAKNYKLDLYLFCDYLEENKINNFRKITYNFLRTYLIYLTNEKEYSNKSIARHISSLHTFFEYLLENNVIESNPMNLINSPKKEMTLPKYLNNSELEDLFNSIDTSKKVGKRDILILEMFYSTGIRLHELVNIKLSDIDFKEKTIKILGKGSKERYVLYGEVCERYLNDYLKNTRPYYMKKDNPYLFLNQKGNNITKSGIEFLFDKIIKNSGIKISMSPHTLRHTFATHMLNDGADLMTVKELLGHSNLSTTGIYMHVSKEHLRNTYLSAHPRARKK